MESISHRVPAIRFPEFKESWKLVRLYQLLYEAKKRNYDLKYDKSQVLSVSGELGVVNQIKHLGRSYAGESVHNYHVLETGDIVYTKSPLKENPYGIIKLNRGESGIVSTLYAVYKVNNDNAIGTFLDYYFSLNANTNRYLRPLVKKGAKNDMKINNAYVLNDPIYVPEKKEQEKIANFLTIIDTKIQQLTHKKVLLEKYKNGVSQKLFSQEIRFKADDGNDFPVWRNEKLGHIAKFFSGGTPVTTRSDYYRNGHIPFIKSGEINQTETQQYITEKGLLESSAKLVSKGDLLYALYGATAGEIAISKIEGAINQAILCIRTSENLHFVYYHLWLKKDVILKTFLQGGQGNLSAEIVKSFVIPLPCMQEQEKISNFLTSIDCKIDFVKQQLKSARTLKKGLLQQMFA